VEFTIRKAIDSEVSSKIVSPNEKIFNYLLIDHENLNNSNIQEAFVSFEVPKKWLTDNGFTKDQVRLKRYSTSWEELNTIISLESADKISYKATTPGLSIFAITASKPEEATTPPSGNETSTTSEELPKDNSRLYWIIGLSIALVITTGAFIYLVQDYFRHPHLPSKSQMNASRNGIKTVSKI
jgi:hypothetical protein